MDIAEEIEAKIRLLRAASKSEKILPPIMTGKQLAKLLDLFSLVIRNPCSSYPRPKRTCARFFAVGSLLGLHLYFVVHTKCEPVPILIVGVIGSVIETILMIRVSFMPVRHSDGLRTFLRGGLNHRAPPRHACKRSGRVRSGWYHLT